MTTTNTSRYASDDRPSGKLPSDPFDLQLAALLGLPNGAHTDPTVVQAIDFYGNAVAYIIQTAKWEEGESAFITVVSAEGSRRFMLPPAVLRTIDRQRASTQTQVRRRHGKRLAEERKAAGLAPAFMRNPGKGRRARTRSKKGGAK